MRASKERWFASLLMHPVSATKYIREHFPDALFTISKRETKSGQMIRNVHFLLDGKMILHARAVVDLNKTKPEIVRLLRKTDKPLAEVIAPFRIRRTRMRATTRTGEFHYIGDVTAKIWERFYPLPPLKK